MDRACDGLAAEIILVDASTDDGLSRLPNTRTPLVVHRMPPGTLTPVLWSTGLAMSKGRIVAFTTGQFCVGREWARSLIAGIDGGATGAAGGLELAKGNGASDAAVFFLRYSAFLGARARPEEVREIPGDNAAYAREALDRHAASFEKGFWEVEFHDRIRGEGARLKFVPGAESQFLSGHGFRSFAAHRFAHGCHFARWRVHVAGRPAWKILLASPAVPLLLVSRIARRVLPRPSDRLRFVSALPALFAFATAWAAGEAWGAVTAASHASDAPSRS